MPTDTLSNATPIEPATKSSKTVITWQNAAKILSVVALLVIIALPVRGEMLRAVSPQDEGVLLVYPTQLMNGAIPNKSFESVYGPANYLVLEAAYETFGTTVTVERLVGLGYELLMIGAVFVLVRRRRGVATASFASALPAILQLSIGITAYSWMGAVAIAAVGLALMDKVLRKPEWASTEDKAYLVLAGVLLGLSISYRLDFVLGVGLVTVVLLIFRRQTFYWVMPGIVLGLIPQITNMVEAGVANVLRGELWQPVFVFESGRKLPLTYTGDFVIFLFTAIFCLVALAATGAYAISKGKRDWDHIFLLIVGLFDLGLLSEAFERTDAVHIAFATGFILGSFFLINLPTLHFWGSSLRVMLPVVIFFVLLMNHFYGSTLRDDASASSETSYTVSNEGRSVLVADTYDQSALQAVVHELDTKSSPGERLFVGPSDLRRTNYNDTYLYFLFPKLKPGSFYLEMEPDVANAPNSGLARQISHCQFLILTSLYNDWYEPNTSIVYRSRAANKIISKDFELLGTWGSWSVLERRPGA
jgi:hypothetical protein